MDLLNIIGTFVAMLLQTVLTIKWLNYSKKKHEERHEDEEKADN